MSAPFIDTLSADYDRDIHTAHRIAREQSWYARTPLGILLLRYEAVHWLLHDKRWRELGNDALPAAGISEGPLWDWFHEILSNKEGEEHARLVYATSEIESLSGAIGRELASLAEAFGEAGLAASEATAALLQQLYGATRDAASAGLRAIVDRNERSAQEVVAKRSEIWKLGSELLQQQAARLGQDDPERLQKHRLQVDALDRMRRVYSVAEHMALTVLPRGVLVGELNA